MSKQNFPAGQLDNIEFVVIFARYRGKWVYSWHKKRKSYEHPGGHVEKGEGPLEAAKRELYEETGITDCSLTPLWDYTQIWDDGIHQNNGRVYYAEVYSLGTLPESEMEKIEFFDNVPDNYTYDRVEDRNNLDMTEKIIGSK